MTSIWGCPTKQQIENLKHVCQHSKFPKAQINYQMLLKDQQQQIPELYRLYFLQNWHAFELCEPSVVFLFTTFLPLHREFILQLLNVIIDF